jgi:DNA-binding MarR family transcriptional regulator
MSGEAVAEVPGGPRGYLVLASLGRGEPSTQVALAQHLGVDRTMMTYLLDDLEDAGLVQRRPDPADRRARRVTLTDTGATRLAELMCGLHRAEDTLLESLTSEERTQLRDLLGRLATAMAPVNPCPGGRGAQEPRHSTRSPPPPLTAGSWRRPAGRLAGGEAGSRNPVGRETTELSLCTCSTGSNGGASAVSSRRSRRRGWGRCPRAGDEGSCPHGCRV